MNQARDSTKPTWLIGIEGRFDVSEPMHACSQGTGALNKNSGLDPSTAQEQKCAYVSDVNRNGTGGEYPYTVNAGRRARSKARSRVVASPA